VKLLLERDQVDPDSRDDDGRTPLSYGARAESEGIVKLLLERDEVDPESLDNNGRTPLSYAAEGDGGGWSSFFPNRKRSILNCVMILA